MWNSQVPIWLLLILISFVGIQLTTSESHEVQAQCGIITGNDLKDDCDTDQTNNWISEEDDDDYEDDENEGEEKNDESGYVSSSEEEEEEQDDDGEKNEPAELNTDSGLEFIHDGFMVIDGDEYEDKNYFLYHGENDLTFSFLDHVRMFIRRVKGLPGEKMFDERIGSGPAPGQEDPESKPAWCFYPYLLAKLAKIEVKIYELLNDFYYDKGRKNVLRPFPLLVSYLKDIQTSSLRAIIHHKLQRTKNNETRDAEGADDPYLYVGSHPVLIYRMVRRFAEDLQPILSQLMDDHEDLIWDIYEKANKDLVSFPEMQDVTDALTSIKRLQGESLLKTSDFARGILEDVETHVPFNALHALEVGAFYFEERSYDYAIEWIYFGLQSVLKSPAITFCPEIETVFQSALEFVIQGHNVFWPKMHREIWHPSVFNATIGLPFQPHLYKRMADVRQIEAMKPELRRKQDWNWAVPKNFDTVCSGITLMTEEEKAKLKCWYERSRNSYWLINPLKVESLSEEPQVIQVYEFIGDKLIEKMKQSTVWSLKRSTVVDRQHPTKSVVDKTRTSSQTWLYDNNYDGAFMVPLTRSMELLSGLTIMPSTACDAYQVATYGPSHHYAAHIDSFEDSRRAWDKGNRITTIMGYLSSVAVGGRTGFPVAGTFADPIKGSVVMWNNLKRNGIDRDVRTWHGGCPVTLGVKWITNKWVYYKDNFRHFPCTLEPEE